MRTTVQLPPSLMQAAKARSAERGESLKQLFARAVAVELGRSSATQAHARVALPLFGRAGAAVSAPTNADLEQALADDEAVGVGRGRTRR